MRSIKGFVSNEIVIEKSRFITYIFNVVNIDEVNRYIEELKKKYIDATHVVYGFILDNTERSNDNGEPKGTAGIPTIEVLRKEGLMNVLAVTIRYFGGIKLGAGGLIRAYTKVVSECLKLATFTSRKEINNCVLTISYRDSNYLDKNLDQILDLNKKYDSSITYDIKILKEDVKKFMELFLYFKDEYKFEIVNEEIEFI